METRRSLLGRLLCPLCCGLLFFILILLDGSASSETYAVDVEVKDASNMTCLYAKWMMNFSVTYESNISEYKNKVFTLPKNVKYDGSTCGDEMSGPLLTLQFGAGHIWSLNFTKTDYTYQGSITFIYNTDDVELFPDAKRKGPVITSASYPLHPVQLYTVFTCHHVDSVQVGNVTNDFWNVSLQAFLQNGSLSTKYTQCDKDVAASPIKQDEAVSTTTTTVPTTTVSTTTTTVPTTTLTTTTEPTTTLTTTEPTTTLTTTTEPTTTISTTTTAEPTTTIFTTSTTVTTTATTAKTSNLPPAPPHMVKTGEKPVTGNYSVNHGPITCLLANMGLQLNISKQQEHWVFNIDPNTTVVTGNCGLRSADLKLNDNNSTIIDFLFAVKNSSSERFYLKGVNITVVTSDNGSLHAVNNNLSYWDASLGSSYMCNKEETVVVTEGYRIKTFDLRVQPFYVKENKYSTAEDCSPEVDNFFVPIMVGAALAGLVFLIGMAYFVGRRKRHGSSYQQF